MTLAKGEEPYARYATFTQSSGTGKSRMNDELAKSVLYIPINLAAKDADGEYHSIFRRIMTNVLG